MDQASANAQFVDLLFRHSSSREEALAETGMKLAHYTTAENALNILRGKEMWLRSASLMNDFSEIEHGYRCIRHCEEAGLLRRMHGAIQPHHPEVVPTVFKRLSETEGTIRFHTYLASLCEHAADDVTGKLSMWRAYGGSVAGAAIVFNTEFLTGDDAGEVGNQLRVYASPVLYTDGPGLAVEMEKLVRDLEHSPAIIAAADRETVGSALQNGIQFSIVSLKNPGFAEEGEWRLIHTPHDGTSELVKPQVAAVRGVPQVIHKLPLQRPEASNLTILDLPKLIHRVIIGPSAYPNQIWSAFVKLLEDLDVPDASTKVYASQIPLRQL